MSEGFDIENFPTSKSAIRMLGYVTDGFYDKSYVGKWLYQVMGLEYDSVLDILETLPDQMFPETATWGMMYHEMKWGLPIRENLSYEERRKQIYQKRDYRAPMTPYRMEVMLSDLSGCNVYINDIHSPGDSYTPSHPNEFRVTLEIGNNTVDIEEILQKLDKIKQSHTVYSFRVAAVVGIQVGVKPEHYRVIHRICGTYPTVSRGAGIARDEITLGMSGVGEKIRYLMSGEGETGTFPKTSTGLGSGADGIESQVSAAGYRTVYPICGSPFEL